MLRTVLAILSLSLAAATPVLGTTHLVRQDGTGDYTSIGAAMSAAATGDIIVIGAGTYSEYLTVQKSLTFESEGGAAVTILDGLYSQRLFVVEGAYSVVFRGLTFAHAEADEGSALLVWQQADVLVEDCIFAANHASGSNAVHVRHPNSSLRLRNTQFLGNRAEVHSGALSASMSAHLYVDDCLFFENKSTNGHGAMNTLGAYVEMNGCLFWGNIGGTVGALTLEFGYGSVTGCTFHANSGAAGSVRLFDNTFFNGNIVSGELRGYGLQAEEGTVHTCNLYHDNRFGACNEPLGAGEILADPLFCDAAAGVFLLCSGSPALSEEGGCGPMGAFGQGCDCGPIATEDASWGDLKCIFR